MSSAAALAERARAALAAEDEQAAIEEIGRWLNSARPDEDLLHWQGLLLRALDRCGEALPVLHQAAAMAPNRPDLAHSLAQVTFEAGQPATALFESALMLNPASSDIRIGLIAARFAEGHGEQAMEELASALGNNPGWYAGHRQYAQLAALLGQADRALTTIERTISTYPDAAEPALVLADLAMLNGRHEAALDGIESALQRGLSDPRFDELRAASLDELGRSGEAADLFAKLGAANDHSGAVRRMRHCLRLRDAANALQVAEPWLAGDAATEVWPYVSLAWRLLGDRHAEWLEAQQGLVRWVDLDPDAIGLDALAARLRTIHGTSGRFLDQSVRQGTQTSGALFARIEPEIVRARAALAEAVSAHLAGLPAADPHHPQLAPRRDRQPRFSGSWSVRLTGGGYHSSHHHPQGWFSSAFYVALPESLSGTEGHLELGGSPPELGLGLPPLMRIEPRPGRLAIFPSTMWHGTLPFIEGERMTIAFDVAHPIEGTAQ